MDYIGIDCKVERALYPISGWVLLKIVATASVRNDKIGAAPGEVIAVPTLAIAYRGLELGQVIIKTWSENAGVWDWLLENKIVEDLHRKIPVGNNWARLAKVLI